MGLLGGVEDLEREDGEAVEDEAGGFGVERRGGVLLAGLFEEGSIHDFDEIVAGLVERVDGVLDCGDALRRRLRARVLCLLRARGRSWRGGD